MRRFRLCFVVFLVGLLLSGVLLIAGCSGGGGGGGVDPDPPVTGARWTFLVYMCADNNLEQYGYLDVKQMEKVGSDENVNIIVQWDRSGYYDDSVDWVGCRRYKITRDPDDSSEVVSTLLQEMGNTNMGAPETLSDFITWGISNYPAERYMVVLWDHGSGWRYDEEVHLTKGICHDETFDDILSMQDVRQAFASAHAQTGAIIDIVGMDACLMANLEVAFQIRDYARYVVFSEETESALGWPYHTILGDLTANPSMDGKDLGAVVVNRFGEFYSSSSGATQSTVDLSLLNALVLSLNDFCNEAIAKMDDQGAALLASRNDSLGMGASADYKDLGDFLDYVILNVTDDDLKTRAQLASSALSSAVTSCYPSPSSSRYSGLTIWLPSRFIYDLYVSEYLDLQFSQASTWDEFLASLRALE